MVVNQYYSDVIEGKQLSDIIYKTKFNFNNYKTYKSKEYYSWINTHFNNYSFANDYSSKTFDDICGNVEYSLKPQQKFAGSIFNTEVENNGLLIYHGLGSGKTQTGIVIGEAFKYRNVENVNGTDIIPGRQENKVLIVVPAALVEQYYSEIIGFVEKSKIKSASGEILINGVRQYYLNDKSRTAIESKYNQIKKLEEQIKLGKGDIADLQNKILNHNKKLIDRQKEDRLKATYVYEILSHQTFLNKLYSSDNYIERLKSPNGLLIIDEAQNLVSGIGNSYRKILYALTLYANPQFRTVLLTGTPIYDKPFEFGLMLNLLRPRIPFPDGYEAFNKHFIQSFPREDTKPPIPSEMINVELFKKMCSGYISYFKGGNPEAYPYKKTIIMNHFMNPYQYSAYKTQLFSEISRDISSVGQPKEEFIIKVPSKESKNDEITTSVFNNSRMYCNIVFPKEEMSDVRKKTSRGDLANIGLNAFIKILKDESVKDRSLGIETIKQNILKVASTYSSKFANVAGIIEKSEGPVFVYSNYVTYGVESMAAIMNSIGYSAYPGGVEGKRYFIWKGGVNQDSINAAKKAFNSLSNKDGGILKIMFGTQTVMEGVDFKRVRQVHVLDPWWNDSRMQQIIARAIRLCSHSGLPENQRMTDVFIHLSTLGSGETLYKITYHSKDSHENDIVRKAYSLLQRINDTETDPNKWLFYEAGIKMDKTDNITDIYNTKITFKSNQLISIKKLADPSLTKKFGTWKQLDSDSVEQYMWKRALNKLAINRQFERVIKEISIDCNINKNGNIIRLEEQYLPDPRQNIYRLEYLNYSTGKHYTRLGVRSAFQPTLEEPYLTMDDIFSNTAKNSGLYRFMEIESGDIIELPPTLILSEGIDCISKEYAFKNIPSEIVDLTLKKETVPYLMNMDFKIVQTYLSKVGKKEIIPNDPTLLGKLKKFHSQQTLDEKQEIIKEFELFNIGDDLTWELYDIDELKEEYKIIFKKKFVLKK